VGVQTSPASAAADQLGTVARLRTNEFLVITTEPAICRRPSAGVQPSFFSGDKTEINEAKVLLMAATMLTTMASAASDLLLGGNDGILRAHLIRG